MTFNNKTIEDLHNLLVSKEISATELTQATLEDIKSREKAINAFVTIAEEQALAQAKACLLYTSPSPRDRSLSRMPSSA